MCSHADDHFGPIGWQMLHDLFGHQAWERSAGRAALHPGDPIRFVRRRPHGVETVTGHWGDAPHVTGTSEARPADTGTVPVEALLAVPTLQTVLQTQRCVVPLAGYWERRCRGGMETQVRMARKDRRPLLVAGVWHGETTPAGVVTTCTLVTRPPTADLLDVHDQMPALLLGRDIFRWLDASPVEASITALSSWRHGLLHVTPAP